ncbi:MAG: amino acid synthesis family protein [Acidimicrobiales bacterium]
MTDVNIRKVQLESSRIHAVGGTILPEPHSVGSISAVVDNPFSGSFAGSEQLHDWMTSLRPMADDLAGQLRDTLEPLGGEVEGYGKGAVVGVEGELEVAAAWHVPGGAALRGALADPKAMVPSSKKVGVLGSQLDVPMVHIHASYLRSHYDVHPVVVPDAPRPSEVVYILVMSTGERPHPRLGGFGIEEVEGSDGLR